MECTSSCTDLSYFVCNILFTPQQDVNVIISSTKPLDKLKKNYFTCTWIEIFVKLVTLVFGNDSFMRKCKQFQQISYHSKWVHQQRLPNIYLIYSEKENFVQEKNHTKEICIKFSWEDNKLSQQK